MGRHQAASEDELRLASETAECAYVALELNDELLTLERLDRKRRQLEHERAALLSLRRSTLSLLGADDHGGAGVSEPRRPSPNSPSAAQTGEAARPSDATPT